MLSVEALRTGLVEEPVGERKRWREEVKKKIASILPPALHNYGLDLVQLPIPADTWSIHMRTHTHVPTYDI